MALVKGETLDGREFVVDTLQFGPRSGGAAPGSAMQRAFDRLGPPGERGCDWWKTAAEPWHTIAVESGL